MAKCPKCNKERRTYTFIATKRQYINTAVKYLLDYDYPFSFSVKDKGTFINLNLKVKFDSQVQEVIVIDEYDGELPAENLSKGAYDQLFLTIRIAISEEILGEGSGFFIIDDAFLSSDRHRLERQFGILKKLADRGWSIVYFSVKDEVVQLSGRFTENKIIEI